jgi:DNA-binding Xre family transcriptional regulator
VLLFDIGSGDTVHPMCEAFEMPVRFRLGELLEERQVEPIGQSELARESGVSFATVNAIANNRTAQVSLETLDKLSAALTRLLKRAVQPGELVERVSERRGKRG